MKIGIITLTSGANYGQRLQNYALQITCENLGHEAITFNNNAFENNIYYNAKKFIKYVINKNNLRLQVKKERNFKRFNNQYINYCHLKLSKRSHLKKISNCCDCFISGSDQVWNPNSQYTTDVNFLTFVPKNKRISYAASMACDQIPFNLQYKYKDWLNGIKFLSIREKNSLDIINDICGRLDVELVLDPTLLLSRNEWLQFSKKSKIKEENKYVLLYFLGQLSKENQKKIKEYAVNNNLKIIDLMDTNNLKYYLSTPEDFVYLISNAECVITDSYHGTIFSILFNRRIAVLTRIDSTISMNSRLKTLFEILDLQEEKLSLDNLLKEKNQYDYNKTIKNIEKMKVKSMNFLINALDNIN